MKRIRLFKGMCCLTLTAFIGLFPVMESYAGHIKSVSLTVKGEPETGDPVDASTLEITTGSSRYEVTDYEFLNGTINWDRRETPQLVLTLEVGEEDWLSSETLKNVKINRQQTQVLSYEWLGNEDDDGSGLRMVVNLAPISTPGDSALARKKEVEAKYANMRSKKRAAAAIAAEVIYGWYEDGNGWWYLSEDNTFPMSQWKEIQGSWYYFNENGYMVTGWLQEGGHWYYLQENGALLTNAVTPDGYTVGGDGIWIQ
ncbi:MAG: hypothetical protein ACLTKI_00185 [Lachnospiraceae bacterium]